MPATVPGQTPDYSDSDDQTILERLERVEAERDRLAAELSAQRDADLKNWLVNANVHASALDEMKRSISWRVTKPLRIGRTIQKKVAEVGLVSTAQVVAAELRRRLDGRRR